MDACLALILVCGAATAQRIINGETPPPADLADATGPGLPLGDPAQAPINRIAASDAIGMVVQTALSLPQNSPCRDPGIEIGGGLMGKNPNGIATAPLPQGDPSGLAGGQNFAHTLPDTLSGSGGAGYSADDGNWILLDSDDFGAGGYAPSQPPCMAQASPTARHLMLASILFHEYLHCRQTYDSATATLRDRCDLTIAHIAIIELQLIYSGKMADNYLASLSEADLDCLAKFAKLLVQYKALYQRRLQERNWS